MRSKAKNLLYSVSTYQLKDKMFRHPFVQLPLLVQPLPVRSTIYLRYNRSACSISLVYRIKLAHWGLVKTRPSLWVHVDAAWAGVALSCPEHREKCYLVEINDFANSFCANFHKVCMAASNFTQDLSNVLIVGPCQLRCINTMGARPETSDRCLGCYSSIFANNTGRCWSEFIC